MFGSWQLLEVCEQPLRLQIHPHVRVERDSGMCVARNLYELWGRSPYTRIEQFLNLHQYTATF